MNYSPAGVKKALKSTTVTYNLGKSLSSVQKILCTCMHSLDIWLYVAGLSPLPSVFVTCAVGPLTLLHRILWLYFCGCECIRTFHVPCNHWWNFK